MKKKIYVLLLSVLFVSPMFAQGFESLIDKNSQSWTRQDKQTDARAGVITTNETPGADPKVPVGDTAWALILGMGLTYGAYVLARSKKQYK
ncbi:hypothetical protein M2138_000440 [Dysgonomonadaceae bacterium PH5-43]|nr:hypothetical protein [Dysgonomonadaceae bacterium PH5-43]